TVALATSADTPSGKVLPFGTTAGVAPGMLDSGANIPANAVVFAVTATALTLSQAVAADVPAGTLVTFTPVTVASVIAGRRGPLANLAATCANLETPLPRIDIVNECLEFMGSVAVPSH